MNLRFTNNSTYIHTRKIDFLSSKEHSHCMKGETEKLFFFLETSILYFSNCPQNVEATNNPDLPCGWW